MNFGAKVVLFLGALAIVSCDPFGGGCGVPMPTPVIRMTQNNGWTAEPFKTGYTIQFPTGYKGIGLMGFEGNIFYKYSSDSVLLFGYSFCEALGCSDFGSQLNNPTATSDTATVFGQSRILNFSMPLLDSGKTKGKFFFSSTAANPVYGKLYWDVKGDGQFSDALDIQFDPALEGEVQTILGSILKH